MKANELRIGNLIKVKVDGTPIIMNAIVVSINSNNFRVESDPLKYYSYDDCYPTELTENWLVKFGLDIRIIKIDRNGGEDWFDITRVLVNDDVDNPEWGYLFTMNGESLIVIKHVHQLQNLYFALTGEALTIKKF